MMNVQADCPFIELPSKCPGCGEMPYKDTIHYHPDHGEAARRRMFRCGAEITTTAEWFDKNFVAQDLVLCASIGCKQSMPKPDYISDAQWWREPMSNRAMKAPNQ